MIYLTEIHMSGGTGHRHVGSVRWRNPSGGKCGSSTVAELVGWLEANDDNRAIVRYGSRDVRVGVAKGTPPYLRTYADKTWNDNLLSLPRY
jgi:hypothetical protein